MILTAKTLKVSKSVHVLTLPYEPYPSVFPNSYWFMRGRPFSPTDFEDVKRLVMVTFDKRRLVILRDLVEILYKLLQEEPR